MYMDQSTLVEASLAMSRLHRRPMPAPVKGQEIRVYVCAICGRQGGTLTIVRDRGGAPSYRVCFPNCGAVKRG